MKANGIVASLTCVCLLAALSGAPVLAQNPSSPPSNQPVTFLQPKAVDAQPKAEPPPGVKPLPAGPAKQEPFPPFPQGKQGPDKGKGSEGLPMPQKLTDIKIEAEDIAKALPAPELEPGEEGLVISLPAALRLANADAWDIAIAIQQLRIAAAQLQGADVLWLPTLVSGVDYQYHSGPDQFPNGTITNNTHDSAMGSIASPLAVYNLTDVIFTPLSARQIVRAQDANVQTSRNDTLTDLAEAYYNLLEAEADLASIVDVDKRSEELVRRVKALAPEYIPDLEIQRAKAFKHDTEQIIETARQRWRVASAEVARIARLKPTVVLQPLEPPNMRVILVPETISPAELVPIGLARRPELTFYEAQAEAARQRQRQETWRPFLPTVYAGGGGPNPVYPFAFGNYGSGLGSNLTTSAQRSDWDLSAVWTLQNMGFGNLALIRERRAEYDLARVREYKFRDIVAKEVTVAWADIRSASRRLVQSERELREAYFSARKNMIGVSEIKRPEKNINIEVIRPQEVIQSLQALTSAYFNYYGVVADYNRAQFRMYRALGNPSQMLAGHDGLGGPVIQGGPPAAQTAPPPPMQGGPK